MNHSQLIDDISGRCGKKHHHLSRGSQENHSMLLSRLIRRSNYVMLTRILYEANAGEGSIYRDV
jgi:hypothetical protein